MISVHKMTEGKPLPLILLFSVPMLIGNIFQQLYNLVDSIIVGQFVGAGAFAAIGATNSVTFLFFALCNGVGNGGGIVTSQLFGAGEDRQVKNCIVNTGYIMIFFPLVVGLIAYIYTEPLLRILETPADILPDAVVYMKIMCIGMIFVSVYSFAAAMLRALGDSKTPLYFLIFACLLNIVLDLVFVCVFHLGVMGAGIATAISQFIPGLNCLVYALRRNEYFRMKREDLAFNPQLTVRILKLGIPLSLQFSLIAISTMALQRVVNTFGTVTVAAFTATSRIEQLIHQPYQTLGSALSTFTGQNYGAKKMDRVKEGYRVSLIVMALFSLVMLLVMQLFGGGIIKLFVIDAEVISMGKTALRITSIFYVMLGLIYVLRGLMTGVGDSLFALINGIVEVIGRFLVPVFLTGIASIGLWGIWWSVGIVWAISGFTAWIRKKAYHYQ